MDRQMKETRIAIFSPVLINLHASLGFSRLATVKLWLICFHSSILVSVEAELTEV